MAATKRKPVTKQSHSKARKPKAKEDLSWIDNVKPLDLTDLAAARRRLLRAKKEGRFPFRRLTPREEKRLLDKMVRETDTDQLEAECRELIRLQKEGKLIPFEDVLEELGVINRKRRRKPA